MADTTDGDRANRGGFEEAARTASEAVRRAASVLEEELASSLSGVHRLQERLIEERRVDQEAFDDVVRRLKSNGREFIDAAAGRIDDLRADDVKELTEQFTSQAQDLFDTTVSLMTLVPDLVNRLMARTEERLGDDADRPASGGEARPAEPKPRPEAKPAEPAKAGAAKAGASKAGASKAKAEKAPAAAKPAPKKAPAAKKAAGRPSPPAG